MSGPQLQHSGQSVGGANSAPQLCNADVINRNKKQKLAVLLLAYIEIKF